MRVLVVADIRLYREGVALALSRLDDVSETTTAADAAAAVLAVREKDCDVALVDMSIADSVAMARALLAARPFIKVVALGVLDDGPEIITCAQAGISGYVSRDATLEELAGALRCVLRGEAAVSARMAAGLLRQIAHDAARITGAPRYPLTRRECEVLSLLEAGMTNKEIARALDLQLSTVKNHVHSLLAKSGARGRSAVGSALRRSGDAALTA
jgi:two-component system nitrate/nitrite response regulator NarL